MNMPISITRFALSMYANIASVLASTTSVVQAFENLNTAQRERVVVRGGEAVPAAE